MKNSVIRIAASSLPLLCLAGCGISRFHSPTVDVLGSYFPGWMVCLICGLGLTMIARAVLVGLKLDKGLRPAAIVYPCLMTIFAIAVWLLFFQN
jgi:hypothetical protein